jgi:3-deoxy-D-manno-octulosonate 8-phosphate phosphatase (KDO 8-P phosphatase)
MTTEYAALADRAAADSALLSLAGNIRLVCFDVDGTLTDGRLYFDQEGRELKAFHVHDGQGLVLLRSIGIEVALITARHSEVARRRADELGVRAYIGVKDKLACVHALCAEFGIGPEAVCFMGDDLPDLPAMRAVGLSVAPGDAHACALETAALRTRAGAGKGAARELCDLLLSAQGRIDDPLPPHLRGERA